MDAQLIISDAKTGDNMTAASSPALGLSLGDVQLTQYNMNDDLNALTPAEDEDVVDTLE